MYTYDEWGNTVLHIQTGRRGMEILKEAGFSNSMTKEQYEKHMASYRRIQERRDKEIQKELDKILKWSKS